MNKKILYHSKWMKLYKNEKGYIFAERRNKDSVAILCFKKVNNEYYFLIRFQPLIDIKEDDNILFPCLVTGSLENGEDLISTCRRELYEEVGIPISNDLKPLLHYKYVSTTQMNEVVNIFIFDVTDWKFENPKTDGSFYESISFNKWVNNEELKNIIFSNNELNLSSLPISYLLFMSLIKDKKDV